MPPSVLSLLPFVLLTADPQHAFEDWARLRARAFETDERPGSLRVSPWRERPGGAPLPAGFQPPTTLAPLVHAVSPAVVNVLTYESPGEAGVPAGRLPAAVGSGFVLDPDGTVVTNYHVVKDAQWIQVRVSDVKVFDAELVGSDPSTDVAVLRIVGDGVKDLPFVYLGDSDQLDVGDWVLAIGNPFGLDRSVSHGMISAKERVLGVGAFDDFIQTDASINPGNSGGPLFNMRGEVVGVNTAVFTHAQGIGFAVPINMVKDLLPNLLDNGHLERGWLGLTIAEQPLPGDRRVAVVQEVLPGSPAALAGIRSGDRITHVNGRPFDSYLQLLRKVSLLAPGSLVRLTVQRNGNNRELSARVAERPEPAGGPPAEALPVPAPDPAEALGVVVAELDAAAARRFRASRAGVWVAEVQADSPAARAGLRAGDVLTRVDGQPVPDVPSFQAALAGGVAGRSIAVEAERRGKARRLLVDLP